jgi:hypothetical protein
VYKILPLFVFILFSCSGVKNINDNHNRTGKEIIRMLDSLDLKTREELIFSIVKEKNIPSFLEHYTEITINRELDGENYELKYYTLPDYFSLGTDEDYFLIPMTPILAQKIANYYDCLLPTRKMADQIYQAAKIKYYPQPIAPSAAMITIKVFANHNDSIKIQRQKYFNNYSLLFLAAGHKKDVIISNYIYSNLKSRVPRPVVIYGWHKPDGNPIQPLYNGHGQNYADYSHGIRLIKKKAFLNGKEIFLDDLLKDPLLSILISDEGIIEKAYYIIID